MLLILKTAINKNCHRLVFHNHCRRIFVTMEAMLNIKLSERLSPYIRPVNYNLKLHPDMKTGLFQGNVKIQVNITKANNFISLHTKFLNISKVSVLKHSNDIPLLKFAEEKNLEQLVIFFETKITPGDYCIDIDFNGELTRNIVGFYSSRLKDNKFMVASKFQPTYARQAYPCFDEPDFKATYDVTLTKPPTHVALSNMNEISTTKDESSGLEAVKFATSVPMSTYLACFVICDFVYKETEVNANGIGNNFKLRSFAQKNQTHKIDFAQDIGKRATEYYIQYYEVPFPLPKLDMIAIPDYVSGATEHWGLITYRETSFLVDESKASASNKINVANTIAHELAHMWFGNLVTMKWWDDVWLNEGFASYMQVKALNALEPSWSMLDQFLTRTLHSVLVTDAELSSHPIVQTVTTPDEITAIFDSISYNKGSSILRMLEGFIGEENFRRGVSDYLKKFKFGNTVTQDLLSSLEPYFKKANPDLSIAYIMDTWTRQMGYPLLTVTEDESPNTYVVTQSRFLLDPDATYNNDSPFSYRWFIPITYKTSKGVKSKILWFSDKEDSVTINLDKDEDWFKVNNDQVGYYRVNYSRDMWEKLSIQLQNGSKQLTISDRANLLNDVFALADSALVPYDLALNITTYLVSEEDYVPWDAATIIFTKLSRRLLHTPVHDKLEKYIQSLLKPLYKEQTWEKQQLSVIQRLLRVKVLSLAARAGLPDAENKVRDVFLRWLKNYNSPLHFDVEADLRDIVYYYGMKSATQAEWDNLWEIYLQEDDVQELAKLRNALAAPRDSDILKRYLTFAWDEKNIRSQDYLNVLQSISANPSGTLLVWDDVRSRWPQLVERFTLNSRYLGNLIPGITSSFNTEAKLQEMQDFFKKYPDAGAGETARRSALETVANNIKWSASQLPAVTAWLQSHRL